MRIARPRSISRGLLALWAGGLLATPSMAQQPRVLFLRGGAGTGGFLEGGSDEHLSDINNSSTSTNNHGFGELRQLLESEGYLVEQRIEGPAQNNTPIDLAGMDLDRYAIIVFGSNNADYDDQAADAVEDWVCRGGGALFISDANWGRSWGDAPSSDQTFLDRFDLVMNQDMSTYKSDRATQDYVIGGSDRGGHPILAGPDGQLGTADDVNTFDGEGVSPLSLARQLDGVEPRVLAKAEKQVRVNDSDDGGSQRDPGVDDGALVALEFGKGRVVGHFDRNTFFNRNGAGTDLHRHDNTQYARNLFRWLADAPGTRYGQGSAGSQGFVPELRVVRCPQRGEPMRIELEDALGGAVGYFAVGTSRTSQPIKGCTLLVDPVLPISFSRTLPGSGPGQGFAILEVPIPANAPAFLFTLQVFVLDSGVPTGLAASNAVELELE